jgi:RNA polymerase sigma-70 factor (ECF subfamily)
MSNPIPSFGGSDSFADLLGRLRQGDPGAARQVHEEYARRLIALANTFLENRIRTRVDGDDVVQSVFGSFFRRCQTAGWELNDRDSLWALLARITYLKCLKQRRKFHTGSRDVDLEVHPTLEDSSASPWSPADTEPSPDDVTAVTDLVQKLLGSMREQDRPILAMRLQGFEIEEISKATGITERTIFRRFERLRDQLERMLKEVES